MLKCFFTLVALLGFAPGIHAQAPKPSASTTGSAPTQPIAFNHQLHIQTAKMTCNDCHEPRGNGSSLAMPQAPKCMTCHAGIATDKPDVKRLADAAKNEDPIVWARVYRVPSFVTFSHKTHTSAGATCQDCHGPVENRTAISLEKDTSMGTCISCHQAKGAPATCDTCHAIMSKNGRSPFDIEPSLLSKLRLKPADKPSIVASSFNRGDAKYAQIATVLSFLHAPLL